MMLQKLQMLITQKYRINMVLDNLPVTAQDLLDKVSSTTQQQQLQSGSSG